MMTNLFSIFDPSASVFSLNWLIILSPLMIMNSNKMKISKLFFLLNYIMKMFSKDISPVMKKNPFLSLSMISVMFLFLAMSNLFSLFPFSFTLASQVSFSFSMAMIFWFSIQIMSWVNFTSHALKHLVPQGTPNMLKPLMVVIEVISQLIRPITLSVRLTANMVAGHLLLSLLGSLMMNSKLLLIIMIPVSMALTFLEICVSLIQAYVFFTLVTLYSTEVN
uniref:ATP synthase subunit a n=1 Tax=Hygrobates longiporus TaxID=2740590 RepID=A0A6J4EI31_9ACAR|nr:ATPase subunit 6 [Hygrobates longiporus]BCG28121.1 ATPase subunit 6 [Hygrobates longiporus]